MNGADLIQEILPEKRIGITIEKDLEKGFDYRRITIEGAKKEQMDILNVLPADKRQERRECYENLRSGQFRHCGICSPC